jgi:hypothetical protein
VYIGSDPQSLPSPNEVSYYLQARPGGSLFCPFECDNCVFFRITGEPSHSHNRQHQNLLDHIRRTHLDAFWSRAPGTIRKLTRIFHEELKVGQTLGLCMFPHPMVPFPPIYEGGNRAAIGILYRTNLPGQDKIKHFFRQPAKRALSMPICSWLALRAVLLPRLLRVREISMSVYFVAFYLQHMTES